MAEIDDCTNLKQRIQHIISEEIAPLLEMDGGSVEVLSVDEEGVVRVRLLAAAPLVPTPFTRSSWASKRNCGGGCRR